MDWEDRYTRFGCTFGHDPTEFLAAQSGLLKSRNIKNKPILFPGDGYGRNGLYIARGGTPVRAFDLSPTAVSWANSRAKKEGLDYLSIPLDISDRRPAVWGSGRYFAVASLWFRPSSEAEYVNWNKQAARSLIDGGLVLVVSSTDLSPFEKERSCWDKKIEWEDFSTESETRMVGVLHQ